MHENDATGSRGALELFPDTGEGRFSRFLRRKVLRIS